MEHVVRAEASSTASVETVWGLLSQVANWPVWSRHQLAELEREGAPSPDGVGAIRVLGLNPARRSKVNREEVVVFDAPAHFGYTLLSGQPPVDTYRSDVTLTALPGGTGTGIVWESRFSAPGATSWLWALVVRFIVWRWSADLARGADRVGGVPADKGRLALIYRSLPWTPGSV